MSTLGMWVKGVQRYFIPFFQLVYEANIAINYHTKI